MTIKSSTLDLIIEMESEGKDSRDIALELNIRKVRLKNRYAWTASKVAAILRVFLLKPKEENLLGKKADDPITRPDYTYHELALDRWDRPISHERISHGS